MERTRHFINVFCQVSKKHQKIVVHFERIKFTGNLGLDYKRKSFDCDNKGCPCQNSFQCPIFNHAGP